MGFSRQEYWSGLLFPSPGDLPDPGIESWSPALQTDSSLTEPPGKPLYVYMHALLCFLVYWHEGLVQTGCNESVTGSVQQAVVSGFLKVLNHQAHCTSKQLFFIMREWKVYLPQRGTYYHYRVILSAPFKESVLQEQYPSPPHWDSSLVSPLKSVPIFEVQVWSECWKISWHYFLPFYKHQSIPHATCMLIRFLVYVLPLIN